MSERTLDQVRDRIAELQGWKAIQRSGAVDWHNEITHKEWEVNGDDGYQPHPIPLTLDAAAKAMPEGWWMDSIYFGRQYVRATAEATSTNTMGDYDRADAVAPTEIEARFRLALACLEAKEKK